MRFKNIKLPEGQTVFLQLRKVIEEDVEFRRGVIRNDIDNSIEEFWDCFQSKLGALMLMGIPCDVVIDGYEKHIEKLKGRKHEFID